MDNLKILIVEDDPTTCTLLRTTLEMDGYQAGVAHNVEHDDIFSLLNEQRPHILFLDYHLGPDDTLKYLIAIRGDADWQHLPVLMASAIDRSQECLEAGATSFVLKPFNWDELTRIIDEICKQILKREV
ncbi:MAG: response regulator [Anaerolineae bacterium]|nr:response regulator [Anaerolineae bacterium]